MPLWLQHILVLALVVVCLAVVSRDLLRALRNQTSRLAGCGTCKSCSSHTDQPAPADAAPASAAARPDRVVFLPADALTARLPHRPRRR